MKSPSSIHSEQELVWMASPFAFSSLSIAHSIDPTFAAHILLVLQVEDEEILAVRMSFIEEHLPPSSCTLGAHDILRNGDIERECWPHERCSQQPGV
ncbi:unnamed protein product [Victoria cruziana]